MHKNALLSTIISTLVPLYSRTIILTSIISTTTKTHAYIITTCVPVSPPPPLSILFLLLIFLLQFQQSRKNHKEKNIPLACLGHFSFSTPSTPPSYHQQHYFLRLPSHHLLLHYNILCFLTIVIIISSFFTCLFLKFHYHTNTHTCILYTTSTNINHQLYNINLLLFFTKTPLYTKANTFTQV